MRRFVWHNSFRRAFRRRTRNQPRLQERIFQTLERLVEDPFNPVLRSHKLRGQLEGLWACTVEYECRIVFTFESDAESDDHMIVLVDIGTHDEVY